MMKHSSSMVTGRLQRPAKLPLTFDYGRWQFEKSAGNVVVCLVPEQAPWCSLFTTLDAEGAAFSADRVTLREEAEAIVACCWRYGTYVQMLSAGELFPAFRDGHGLSRITDDEMMRINLEFSSAVAAWLAVRDREPEVINRRVRAAQKLLPMPWRARRVYPDFEPDVTSLAVRLTELSSQTDFPFEDLQMTHRAEANRMVVAAYRNGPIEDYHAGKRSIGTDWPGFKRVWANEFATLCRHSAAQLEFHLAARMQMEPRIFALQLFAQSLGSADGWSLTEETSPVCFSTDLEHLSLLRERFNRLARRIPGFVL